MRATWRPMPIDTDDDDLPVSHAIADGWAEFAERVMPTVGGAEHAQAHVAFHFGALYVLQLLQEVVEHKSAEAAAVALAKLTAELDEILKAHAVAVQ